MCSVTLLSLLSNDNKNITDHSISLANTTINIWMPTAEHLADTKIGDLGAHSIIYTCNIQYDNYYIYYIYIFTFTC